MDLILALATVIGALAVPLLYVLIGRRRPRRERE